MMMRPSTPARQLRFGFHDAGTFDARRGTGGANGSIRFRRAES